MATGGGLALPEHLQDEDAGSWFKRFEVCAAANSWDDAKKLNCLPTLLKGRAWARGPSQGVKAYVISKQMDFTLDL